jgi:serine protease AprX
MNTVGTLTRSDDKIASYSSKGPTAIDHVVKPDLAAPGNRILSLQDAGQYLAQTYPSNCVPKLVYTSTNGNADNDYFELSGTSMATPMVAGAAALMLQKDPTLTPDTVKARLMKTADKLPAIQTSATDPVSGITYISENDIFTIGAGYLDVPAALASTDAATASAASPAAAPNGNGSLTLVLSNNSLGSATVIWGSNAIWGTTVIWGSNAIWGTTVIWGSSAVMGTTVIWGSSAIWGTSAVLSSEATRIAINGEQ